MTKAKCEFCCMDGTGDAKEDCCFQIYIYGENFLSVDYVSSCCRCTSEFKINFCPFCGRDLKDSNIGH